MHSPQQSDLYSPPSSSSPQRYDQTDSVEQKVRERQWIYLGPIIAAPIAHICVTLYRDAKTPRQKQLLLGVGIIGSTVATISMRLYLMAHAGYPGGSSDAQAIQSRIRTVSTEEQRQAIENPGTIKIMKDAFRGFG